MSTSRASPWTERSLPGFRLVNTDPVPQFGPKVLVLRDLQDPIPMRVAPNVLAIDTNRYTRTCQLQGRDGDDCDRPLPKE